MNENASPFGALTPEKLAEFYASAEKAIQMFKALAVITPTNIDDYVLIGAERFLAATKPFVGEPWFVNLLNTVIGFIWKTEEGRKFLEKLA